MKRMLSDFGIWSKIIVLLIRRYGQSQEIYDLIRKADGRQKKKKDGVVYATIVKLMKKISKVSDQAIGLLIDDLQTTKEEAVLYGFLKELPHKDFVRTGRTVTLTDGTVFR